MPAIMDHAAYRMLFLLDFLIPTRQRIYSLHFSPNIWLVFWISHCGRQRMSWFSFPIAFVTCYFILFLIVILAPKTKEINHLAPLHIGIWSKNLESSDGTGTYKDRVNDCFSEGVVILRQFAGKPIAVGIITHPLLGGVSIMTKGGGQINYLRLVVR